MINKNLFSAVLVSIFVLSVFSFLSGNALATNCISTAIKIDNVIPDNPQTGEMLMVYVRNIGAEDVTGIGVYYNDEICGFYNETLSPGQIAEINTDCEYKGDSFVLKVQSMECPSPYDTYSYAPTSTCEGLSWEDCELNKNACWWSTCGCLPVGQACGKKPCEDLTKDECTIGYYADYCWWSEDCKCLPIHQSCLVEVKKPNLIVEKIRVIPEKPKEGDRVRLFATIKNVGNAPAIINTSSNEVPNLDVLWESKNDYTHYSHDGESIIRVGPISCSQSFGNYKSVYNVGESYEEEICGNFIFKATTSNKDIITVSVNLPPNVRVDESSYDDNAASVEIGGITTGYDVCNNGKGWSEPSSSAQKCGWPPGSKGYVKDCCCCYLTTHVHDLGKVFNEGSSIEIEYKPGWAQGCTSPMFVYYSEDGKEWNLFYNATVTQETWHPKTIYTKTLTVPGKFEYIKIYIPKCYNDYSSAKVIATGGGGGEGRICPTITMCMYNSEEDSYKVFSGCDYLDAKDEGWVDADIPIDECDKENEQPSQSTEVSVQIPETTTTTVVQEDVEKTCGGCWYKDKCVQYGVRVTENGVPSYCDFDGAFKVQKENGEDCLNNYECKSNFCSDGECYNIKGELKETKGLLESIMSFLRSLFGFGKK